MTTMRRNKRLGAFVVGLTVVAGASVASASTDTTQPGDTEPTTAETTADTSSDSSATTTGDSTMGSTVGSTMGTTGGSTAAQEPMTITMELNPDAVWEDGTPLSTADFKCFWDATMNTPGSLSTAGYSLITSIEEGATPQEVVVTLSEPYAAYKNLFEGLIKAAAFEDCNDVSADMRDLIPFSARPYMMESWSLDQLTLVANPNWWGDPPVTDTITMVPRDESALMSGEVDFIFPQAFAGLIDTLESDPDMSYTPGFGTNYEGLYFQQLDGPFADDAYREAFSRSIDRDLILSTIYDPLFPGAPLLNCGFWVPNIGDWCDNSVFGNEDGTDKNFDPAAAEQVLTDAGWTKNDAGMWANADGEVPQVRWMVNTPNPRREDTQALMIPEFQAAGFDVVSDNCDAACVFQQRLPALDYDLAMFIFTASPDPTVTTLLDCDNIPTPENNNIGQNTVGWCNEEATALMRESDRNLDIPSRVEQIHQIAQFVADDFVMLPLYQFPNIAAWNTTKVGGPVDADAANFQAFQNIDRWEDLDGDGQIIIGAEQWPECLNIITECSSSSWAVWTGAFKVLPFAWNTTGEGEYVPGEILAGEPEVMIGGEVVDTGSSGTATTTAGTMMTDTTTAGSMMTDTTTAGSMMTDTTTADSMASETTAAG